MRDLSRAERLLSLFTSPDSAAGIAGDLMEERQGRGSAWFWRHVWQTAFGLWRGALQESPVMVLLLTAAGLMLLAVATVAGTAALYLFDWRGSPLGLLALSLVWLAGALCAGATLVGTAPQRGMVACVLLAIALEALLIAFGLTALLREPPGARFALLYGTGLTAMPLLLLGGALVRGRWNVKIACDIRMQP